MSYDPDSLDAFLEREFLVRVHRKDGTTLKARARSVGPGMKFEEIRVVVA